MVFLQNGGALDVHLPREQPVEHLDDTDGHALEPESVGRFEPQKPSADNEDGLPLSALFSQIHRILQRPQCMDARFVRPRDRRDEREAPCRQQDGIRGIGAFCGYDGQRILFDLRDGFGQVQPDPLLLEPLFPFQDELFRGRLPGNDLRQPNSRVKRIRFIREDFDLTFGIQLPDGFARARSRVSGSDYDIFFSHGISLSVGRFGDGITVPIP